MLRLSLRGLVAHRLRFGLTAAAVVLGVAFVAGTFIFRDTSVRGFDRLFSSGYAGVEVVVRAKQTVSVSETTPPVPASLLDTIRQRVPDAVSVYGTVEGYAAVVGADGQVVGGGDVPQLGGEWLDVGSTPMRLASGRAPRAADEVAVDATTADRARVKAGDRISVLTQREPRTMLVTGTFTFPPESRLNGVVTYVAFERTAAQALLVEPGQFSMVLVNGRPGVAPAQLRDAVAAALPAGYEATTGNKEIEEAKKQIRELLDILQIFLLVFAGVSLFVGSFIIFNTFAILVTQRTRELALLRAVGGSRRQVTRLVLLEALGVGVVGSTLGLAAGLGLAVGLRVLFRQFGIDLPADGLTVTPATVLWSYAVGVPVTMVAAYVPARRAGRLPPVAALRDDAVPAVGSMRWRTVCGTVLGVVGALGLAVGLTTSNTEEAGGLTAIGCALLFLATALLAPLLGRPVVALVGWPLTRVSRTVGRMSVRNARRDPRRTAATASALMVGLALVAMVSVLADSMKASVGVAFDREFGADYSVTPRGFEGFSPATLDPVRAAPGVRAVVPVRYGAVLVGTDEVPLLVADLAALEQLIRLRVEQGARTLGRDEIAVQRGAADARGWKVGSTVAAEYPDGTAATLRVAAVLADNQLAGVPYLMAVDSYLPHGGTTLVNLAYVDTDDSASARRAVKAAFAAYPNLDVQDRQQAKAKAKAEVDELLDLTVVLLVLSILIAALGIVNTLSLSVLERTREIGLLRAVGVTRRQIRRMVRYEAVLIALFGGGLGLVLGVLFGWANQRASRAGGIEVLSVPYGLLAWFAAAALLVGVVAAIWPARRASRLEVLRAIATP